MDEPSFGQVIGAAVGTLVLLGAKEAITWFRDRAINRKTDAASKKRARLVKSIADMAWPMLVGWIEHTPEGKAAPIRECVLKFLDGIDNMLSGPNGYHEHKLTAEERITWGAWAAGMLEAPRVGKVISDKVSGGI